MVWAVAWPIIRVVHGALVDLIAGNGIATPNGILGFFIYQVLVSVPFAIGFWWLHENFAPRWWFRIRDRNPVANHFIRVPAAVRRRRGGGEGAPEGAQGGEGAGPPREIIGRGRRPAPTSSRVDDDPRSRGSRRPCRPPGR